MSDTIIVSRHIATVEYLKAKFGDVPSFSAVTIDDVRGKHVIGNIPLDLAAEADCVTAVLFTKPPRGQEIDDLEEAGIHLRTFVVYERDPND